MGDVIVRKEMEHDMPPNDIRENKHRETGIIPQWHWQERGTAWKGVGIYHVTLTVTSREPLLGRLVIPDNDPKKAVVERTELGNAVVDCIWKVPKLHPEVRVISFDLMPDHIHTIWHVVRPMPVGIKTVVRGFWQGAKKCGRAYSMSISPSSIRDKKHRAEDLIEHRTDYSVFTEMPFIRPLSRKGQLNTMIRYTWLNPQRLATKRLMPEYFRVQEGIEIAGRTYCGVGNAELLQKTRYMPVHVRNIWVEDAERHGDNKRLRDYMNGCVIAARNGAVMVSPFISPKEKEVMEVLLKEGLPFIYIADNGFRDYYKPQDSLFDAVARKQVLILSPWDYDPDKRHVTRAECVAMNKMAEEIAQIEH